MEEFYANYYGHTLEHLQELCLRLRPEEAKEDESRPIMWLVGDSSLDNKHWLKVDEFVPAVNGYEDLLSPPQSMPDVAYHLNRLQVEQQSPFVTVNCAVEESTLADRFGGCLKSHDEIVRDNIRADDVLVVSVGGNDIALKPSQQTRESMQLMLTNSLEDLLKGPEHAQGMEYFIDMFRDQIQDYVEMLTQKCKPRAVLVCMIYYPDETEDGSWASPTLRGLGYNQYPALLQTMIHSMFEHAVCQINIPDTTTVHVPLFEVMDGTDTSLYVSRVEPSDDGGSRMADLIMNRVSV